MLKKRNYMIQILKYKHLFIIICLDILTSNKYIYLVCKYILYGVSTSFFLSQFPLPY